MARVNTSSLEGILAASNPKPTTTAGTTSARAAGIRTDDGGFIQAPVIPAVSPVEAARESGAFQNVGTIAPGVSTVAQAQGAPELPSSDPLKNKAVKPVAPAGYEYAWIGGTTTGQWKLYKSSPTAPAAGGASAGIAGTTPPTGLIS